MKAYCVRKRSSIALVTVVLYLTGFVPGLFTAGVQGQRLNSPSKATIRAPRVAPATGSQPARQACPEITTLSPPMLIQGTSATILFTGTGLDTVKNITLGAGVTTSALKVLSATSAQITATVESGAPVGDHAIMVDSGSSAMGAVAAVGCGVREARPRLRVVQRSTETPGTVILAAPDVVSVDPGVLLRGQSTTLTLRTKGFTSRIGVDFGPGIEITSPLVQTGDVMFTMGVKVAADAPLGKHPVVLKGADGKTRTATASVMVNAAADVVVMPKKTLQLGPFSLKSVVPNTWVAGNAYKITLNGTGFVEGMEVDFSDAVKLKGKVVVVNDAIAQAEVVVIDTLTPEQKGERHAKARKASTSVMTEQPAVVTIYPLTKTASGKAPVPKGKIVLKEPDNYGTQGSPEFTNYYGAPLLQEGLQFKWEEATPNVQAAYFELRILSGDGSKVIKRVISPYTTYTITDEFIYDLMTKELGPVTAQAASMVNTGKPGSKVVKVDKKVQSQGQSQGQSQSQQGSSQSTPANYPAETQLLWEVAGYKVVTMDGNSVVPYTGSVKPDGVSHIPPGTLAGGVSKQQMSLPVVKSETETRAVMDSLKKDPTRKAIQVAQEVEISDRWPLSRPDRPTGLACGNTGVKKGFDNRLATDNVGVMCEIDFSTGACKKKTNGDPIIRPYNLPGDVLTIAGSFMIPRSPYAIRTETKAAPPPGSCGTGKDMYGKTVPLLCQGTQGPPLNIVLDWGDPYSSEPSPMVPISGITTTDVNAKDGGGVLGDVVNTRYDIPKGSLTHTYNHWGTFNVRVYVLPDDVMQSVDPATMTRVFDKDQGAPHTSFERLLTSYNPATAQANTMARDAAKYPYMVFCKIVDIRKVEDPASNGPLHLKAIDVTGFPGHEPGKANACKQGQQNPYTMKAPASLGGLASQKGASLQGTKARASVANAGKAFSQGKSGSGEQYGCDSPFTVCGVATECDDALYGEGKIDYYGTGYAGVRWKRDNVVVRYAEHFVKESPARDNLGKDPKTWPPVIIGTDDSIPNSGNLLEKQKSIGLHNVTVESMALPKIAAVKLQSALEAALDDPKIAARVNGYLGGSSQGGKVQKMGYLSPYRTATQGTPTVAYVNDYMKNTSVKVGSAGAINLDTAGDKGLPAEVSSLGKVYKLGESDPSQLCRIKFPSANGDSFNISGLQNNYVKNGDSYSGCGTMTVKVNRMVGVLPEEIPVVVKFQNWKIPDGLNIKEGILDTAPQKPIKVPGANGTLEKVAGKASGGAAAGNGVEATLSLTISDSLRMQGVEKPQEWKGLVAPITASGDWYKDKQSLKTTFLGWSGFKIQADNNVTFDFSITKASGPVSSLCQSGGDSPKWMGVRLGTATLIPYVFDQVAQGWQAPVVSDWAIDDMGICGQKTVGAFDAKVIDGSLHFDSIDVAATGGTFDATYKGMIARFPWINAELKGDSKIHWQGGGNKGLFLNLTGESPQIDYGNVKMKVKNIIFTQEEGIGWTSRGDATFAFLADGKTFDGFTVPNIFYDFAGMAYFAKGAKTQSLPRSGSVKLSKTPLNLADVTLDTKVAGANRLQFTFGTKLNLSKVMPVVDVPVLFSIKRQGAVYSAAGPTVNPFKVGVGFPEVNPTVKVDINTQYTGSGTGSGTAETSGSQYAETEGAGAGDTVVSDASPTDSFWSPGKLYAANTPRVPDLTKPVKSGYYLQYAANGPTPNDQFKGDVDLAMFGGPPVKAQFRLGYMGENDYWIARVTIPLGPSGVPIVPPFLSLYALRGGLGYNFPISAFANDIYTAVPDMSGNYMFMAGMRVGSPDKFAYMMDGDFSVNTAGFARMDYKAWLLSTSQEGNGNFHGFFQYGDGNFDGALAGKIGVLGDLVSMEIPENAATLHFGSDYWQINAGKKEGPRIKLHLIYTDVDGYFGIGSQGIGFGGTQYYNMSAGIGKISGWLDTGIHISPAPSISGFATGGISAEICAFDCCIGPSAEVGVTISAPPPRAGAHACFGFDFGLWEPEVCGDFSL